jgi:hypothetical protein
VCRWAATAYPIWCAAITVLFLGIGNFGAPLSATWLLATFPFGIADFLLLMFLAVVTMGSSDSVVVQVAVGLACLGFVAGQVVVVRLILNTRLPSTPSPRRDR